MIPKLSLAWRLAPIGVAAAALLIVGWLYGPRDVELLVRMPEGGESVRALTVRVSRADGREILRVRQDKGSESGRTVVIHSRMPRGTYAIEAWPEPSDGRAFQGSIDFAGDETVEVEMTNR